MLAATPLARTFGKVSCHPGKCLIFQAWNGARHLLLSELLSFVPRQAGYYSERAPRDPRVFLSASPRGHDAELAAGARPRGGFDHDLHVAPERRQESDEALGGEAGQAAPE